MTDAAVVDLAVRLWSRRVLTPSGCWEWAGARNDYGYGLINIGRTERVHRIAYVLRNGPIDKADRVLHRCDNPPCFNPSHLFKGTAQDNTDDMHAKGRWKKPRSPIGSLNNLAILNEADVLVIIERLLAGETRTRIALDYGVTIGAVSRIAVGKNWKHLTAGRGIVKSTRGIKRASNS